MTDANSLLKDVKLHSHNHLVNVVKFVYDNPGSHDIEIPRTQFLSILKSAIKNEAPTTKWNSPGAPPELGVNEYHRVWVAFKSAEGVSVSIGMCKNTGHGPRWDFDAEVVGWAEMQAPEFTGFDDE